MADLLTLGERSVAAQTVRFGSATFEVAAGKYLKIETSPAGVEILNQQVPAGKKWTVTAIIEIQEVNI